MEWVIAIIGILFTGGFAYQWREIRTLRAAQREANAKAEMAEKEAIKSGNEVKIQKVEIDEKIQDIFNSRAIKYEKRIDELIEKLSKEQEMSQSIQMENKSLQKKLDKTIKELNAATGKLKEFEKWICSVVGCEKRIQHKKQKNKV